jgi:hypothetical protein
VQDSRKQLIVPLSLGVVGGPALLSVGFGIWNPAGAWQQSWVLAATTRLSELVEVAPPLLHGAGLLLPAIAVGILVAGLASWRGAAPLEFPLVIVGAVGGAGLFAVGAGLDRPLFWAGILLAGLAGRRVWEEGPDPGEIPPWVRGGAAAFAFGLAWLAGLTLLEGPSMHSPAFRLRDGWMAGPGRSAWTSGGAWLGLGAVAFGSAWLTPATRPRRWRAATVIAVLVVVVTGLLPAPLAVARRLSALGLVLVAVAVGPTASRWVRDSMGSGSWRLWDVRRVALAGLPIVAWAGICALRGLTVGMWTVPSGLPPGVEQLVSRKDLFSLAADPVSGGVLYTDRERDLLGLWTPDGVRTWEIWDPGGVGVEEVGPPVNGVAWVSVVGDESSGVVAVDLDGEQGAYVSMPGCWVSDWVPQPGTDRVLIPCESNPVARWFDAAEGHRDGVLALAHEVETAVFHPDGDRFFAVGLWHTASVIAYGLPKGEVLRERLVGPFNWALALDAGRNRLWVSRFFEGIALVLDAETLVVVDRVRLSFGVRAMIHEPVHDRIWAAAAYSGVLWSVSAGDPKDRVAYALCGQARDLAADAEGRVFVATDCGLFRIDPRIGS